jgi:hypothetical protein
LIARRVFAGAERRVQQNYTVRRHSAWQVRGHRRIRLSAEISQKLRQSFCRRCALLGRKDSLADGAQQNDGYDARLFRRVSPRSADREPRQEFHEMADRRCV